MIIENSPIIFSTYVAYNTFFSDGKCFFDTTYDMIDLYRLDSIADENDRIILINKIQENELHEKGYVHDGYKKCDIDNLKHVYVRKYKLKTDNGKKTQTTDLSDMRDENCKYSRFLCDLILEYYYIQHLSFEKVSELLKLNYGLDIDYRRVCDLYNRTIDNFIFKKYEEVADDIRNGKIKLGQCWKLCMKNFSILSINHMLD